MKIIKTSQAPQPIGPYSQGMVSKGVLYSSGQGPLDPQSGDVPVGITAQTELACQNIGAVLKAGKSDFKAVLKTTCFLQDMADFAAFNQIYARYFVSKPARTCVAVKKLPANILCEIEVVAISADTEA